MFKSTPKTQKKRKNAERLRSIEEAKKRKMAELENLEKLKEKLEASDDETEDEVNELNEEYEISEGRQDSAIHEENELSMHIANMSTTIANQEKQVSKFIARQAVAKELPDFNGDPEEWPLFYAMFQQSSKDGDFTAIENTMRLAKALKGDARDRVKTLIATAAAPEDIINVLQSHFGHPRQVINRMMTRIASTPDPKDGDPESIVKFATVVENLSFGLKWLDKGRYMDSPWVTNDIERKLSPTMRMLWAMKAKEIPNYSVTDLATWLNDQSKISLNILPMTSLSTQSSTGERQETNAQTRTPKIHSSAVMTTQIAKNSYKCAVCEEGHYTNECPKLKDSSVNDRYNLVKDLCWGCLGRNHRLNTCVRRRTCGLEGCKRMHHRLLHRTDKSAKVEDEQKENDDKTDPCGCDRSIRTKTTHNGRVIFKNFQ
ncbi:uncharacterized protein LOC129807361 [Phlebotomus papatasi]|uniref:uncharacterized protein LOC129807361 n=1 Tax=Phlebotomus papatasi TaxID=29031 RepID=UPI002483F486|nr:uncharacterized protein LOC129807361 [Phlebotomus papatasi]